MKRILQTSVAGIIVLLTSAVSAAAYIDPITGSIIIQAIIGGFAAVAVSIRSVREKIMGLFRAKKVAEKGEFESE